MNNNELYSYYSIVIMNNFVQSTRETDFQKEMLIIKEEYYFFIIQYIKHQALQI